MGTAVKVVVGGVGVVAIWLLLAVTLFSGTGSVAPRTDPHTGTVNTVATTGATAEPTLDPRP